MEFQVLFICGTITRTETRIFGKRNLKLRANLGLTQSWPLVPVWVNWNQIWFSEPEPEFVFWRTGHGTGLPVPFMCKTRTILIYFLNPKPEVLHKSKEPPNARVLWLLLSSFPPLLEASPLCCNIQIKSFTYCPRVKMSTHGEPNCLQNDNLNFSDSFLKVSIGRILHNIRSSVESSS